MRIDFKILTACVALSTSLFSCQKENKTQTTSIDGIPVEILNKIAAQGYSVDNVMSANGGYIVENDIFLSNEILNKPNLGPDLRVGEEEQYHTTNLITGLPRTISISVSGLKQVFVIATDTAIARYNALNLRLHFVRVASGGQIQIAGEDLGGNGVLGRSSGFPDATGNPASTITINSRKTAFGSNPDVQWAGTVIAHEIGHTIGFRHTDYANRNYSCGFSVPKNEGDAGVGAIWIPGTRTGPRDPGSWMLACTDGSNRPFNPNDVIALNYLYH
jgi:hypothetical protein